jgi:hypothetical protein
MMGRPMQKAIAVAFVLGAASVLSQMARGAPPPPTSDDYKILAPYAGALRELTYPGSMMGCCDTGDCRPANYRIANKGGETFYEVFIAKLDAKGSGWEDGTNKWERVPDNVIIAPDKRKDIPVPVACWIKQRRIDNGFICFTPGGAS